MHTFGEFELDETLYQLRRGTGDRAEIVKIEPKVFDVLLYLLRHRDRVVGKDELLEELWPGSVSESVLPRCITAARRALGDDSARQGIIETIRRRGYRFVAPVTSTGTAAVAPPEPPAPPVTTTPAPSLGPPFVGRAQALGQLSASLDTALSGRGQLVLLSGDAGIGKTRTAAEVCETARQRGGTVLTGRCFEGEGAPAFWPWVQVLRRALDAGVIDPRGLGLRTADLAALVPEIRDRVPDVPEPPAVTPEQARFRQFDAVTTVLTAAADDRPLVIVLDDLHWADTPSLLLLQFLARAMERARLLVVATFRDTALPRRFGSVLGALAREPVVRRIGLEGLGPREVGRFVGQVAGEPCSPEWVARIHAMTEGNPFFLGEIVRVLVEEGRLAQDPDAEAVPLPRELREAVGRRLAGLSDPCHQALTVASVLGRDFSTPVLSVALAKGLDRLLDVLHEAVTAGLLVEQPGSAGRYAFAHALIRETLYEDLPTPDRVRMHLRVGEAMEAVHGHQPGPHLAELSHHFCEGAAAGDPNKAVEYSVAAAHRASSSLAYEDAARHYERALEAAGLVAPVDEGRRARLLLRLGEAKMRSGEDAAGRRAYRQAAELARGLSDARLLAKAALGMAQHADFGMPRDAELVETLREAERTIGDTDDRLRAHVLARMAVCAPWSESVAERRGLSKRALDLARTIDDPTALGYALAARFWALAGPDDHDERLTICARMAELADETEDRNLAFMAQEMKTITLTGLGDMPAARRALAEVQQLANELGAGIMQWYIEGLFAGQDLCEGRYAEAERRIASYVQTGQQLHPGAMLLAAAQRLWLARARDELDQYLTTLDNFKGMYSWGPRVAQAARAFVCADRGQLGEAREALDVFAAGDGLRTLPKDEQWLATMAQVAFATYKLRDRARAEIVRELMLPYASRPVFHERTRVHSGVCARFVAMMCTVIGDHEQARARFEEAITLNASMGARPYHARCLHDYADYLGTAPEDGGPPDGASDEAMERAARLASEALAIAQELEMPKLTSRVQELLARLDG